MFPVRDGRLFSLGAKPGIPQSVTLSISGAGAMSVEYTAPLNNGGMPITSYEYSTDSGSNWTTTPSNPFTVSGYGNAAAVSVLVRAKNAVGAGSSTTGTGTTASVPSAPTLTLTNTGTVVDWSWTAPSDGGLAITGYQYAVSTNAGAYPGNSTTTDLGYPANINNTRNTSYYKLRVRAVNAAGVGEYSESGNSTAWALTSETRTVSEDGMHEACSTTNCGTCGGQARERKKTRSKSQQQDTYTRLLVTDVATWYDTTSYPDWAGIAFSACYNVGSCVEVSPYDYRPTIQPFDANGNAIQYYSANRNYPFYYQLFFDQYIWGSVDGSGTLSCQTGQNTGAQGPGNILRCASTGTVTTSGADTCTYVPVYCC